MFSFINYVQKEKDDTDDGGKEPKDRDRRVSSDDERTRTGSESSDKDRYRDNKV